MAIDFTEELLRFLNHPPNNRARVLAGPGTGKSTVVIEFASRLLKKRFSGLRLIPFTRAPSKELAQKIREAGDADLRPSTIHSFAVSLVFPMEKPLKFCLPCSQKNRGVLLGDSRPYRYIKTLRALKFRRH